MLFSAGGIEGFWSYYEIVSCKFRLQYGKIAMTGQGGSLRLFPAGRKKRTRPAARPALHRLREGKLNEAGH